MTDTIPAGMTQELRDLIERARHHKMTPQEKFEQRVSFVYGQQDWSSGNTRSKDEIRAAIIDIQGAPVSPVPTEAAQPDETGWLVERTDTAQPTYFALCRPELRGLGVWTTDASKALRCSREQDANEIVLILNLIAPTNAIATEHKWVQP